jgi:hypothetical protein
LWDDAVLVWYAPSPGEARILEKDIVEFWGRYAGVQTYTAVLGNIVQIPGVTAYGLTRSTIVTQETETGCVIHLAQFQALKTGMSYAAAMSTLGCEGTEISRVDLPGAPQFATVMYSWKGAAIANANAMFQNDRLINKAQVGLQ